jgi:hypothetical protein
VMSGIEIKNSPIFFLILITKRGFFKSNKKRP